MRVNLARLWIAAAGLCAGVIAAPAARSSYVALLLLLGGATSLSMRRRPLLGLIGVVLVSSAAGMMTAHLRVVEDGVIAQMARSVPRCTFEARVTEHLGGLGSLWEVRQLTCGDRRTTAPGSVVLSEPVIDPGTRIEGEAWLIPLGEDHFDMARRRLGAQATIHLIESEIAADPGGLHRIAARVRDGLHEAVAQLDPRHAALIEGLTIGDTSGFSPEAIEAFRGSGLSHVLAVSGSNVAIVVASVLLALKTLPMTVRVAVGLIALGLFVLIVGPDASVLRAGVMGIATLLCLLRGRQAEPLAILAVAIIGVVGLRPAMLYSVGMHLSVAATAGIILFSASLAARLPRMPEALRSLLAATLAAQVGVAPILMYVFGEISITAPVANLLALPVVGVTTVVGLGAGCLGIVSTPLASAVVSLVAPAAWWIDSVAASLGSRVWSSLSTPAWAGLGAGALVAAAGVRALRAGQRELSIG